MKRKLTFALSSFAVLTMTACGTTPSVAPSEVNSENPSVAPAVSETPSVVQPSENPSVEPSVSEIVSVEEPSEAISIEESTSEETSEYSISRPDESELEYVENYELDSERKYTGYLYNGVPEKEGTLTWVNTNCVYTGEFHDGVYEGQGCFEWLSFGHKVEGEFRNGYPYYAVKTFDTTMTYTGQFNSNFEFDGYGVFDWNTHYRDGSVKAYGWLYEGEFRNGDMTGCRGKVTFTCARDGSNTDGIYWFEGEMSAFPGVKANQTGKGCIHFGDKSVYTGELYYNGRDYLRTGKGEMDFSQCGFGYGSAWGCGKDEYLYKYVGEFDYTKSGWIQGNGIMYYMDKDGNPTRYAKGNYSACHLLGEYEGENPTLEEGFTPDMETPYLRFREDYDKYMESTTTWAQRHVKYLFAGDSYMAFMCHPEYNTPFEKYFGDYDAIDVGCGGSTTADWLCAYYDDLIMRYTPDNIMLHIGGNDLGNFSTVEKTTENLNALLDKIHKDLPNTKVYIIPQNYSPAKDGIWQSAIKPYIKNCYEIAKNRDYVEIIEVGLITVKDLETDTPVDNINSLFRDDKLHFNDAGYVAFSDIIKQYMTK